MSKDAIRTAAALAIMLAATAGAMASDAAFEGRLAQGRRQALATMGVKAEPKAASWSWGGTPRPGPESSWDAIYEHGLWPDFPKIQIRSTFYPVISLCVDGDNIRPHDPRGTECVRWEGRGGRDGDMQCVETRPTYVSTPVVYQQQVCVRWRNQGDDQVCEASETRTYRHPTSWMVDVLQRDAQNDRTLFSKRFDMPACR